jgi:hypothetical protein
LTIDGYGDGALRPGAVHLRAVEGEADEPLLVFQAGFAVGPFSLGQNGDWKVRASDVAPLHVLLWFDGHMLYAAKSQGAPDVWVDGQALREDWSVLSHGTELRLGAARIAVSTDEGLPETREATSQIYPPTTVAKVNETESNALERLGLVRGRRATLRGLLLLGSAIAGLLLWLAVTRSPRVERRAVPGPERSPGATEISKPRPAHHEPGGAPAPSAPIQNPDASRDRPREERRAQPSASLTALERRAADAVLRGDFDLAQELYRELSLLDPDSSAFSAARKIAARNARRDGRTRANIDDEP